MRPAMVSRELLLMTALGIGAFVAGMSPAKADVYVQTNLVSDIPGVAEFTDPALKNPWGVSESGTSPFWISDQATGQSTLYTVTGTTLVSESALSVTSANPTGQVNNPTTGFTVTGTGNPALFIFANLNGTITAWNATVGTAPGTPAVTMATTAGASYTGLAIDATTRQIYAANGKNGGSINVFNSSFQQITPTGNFVDPNVPSGLVPFNIRELNGLLYVTYAPSTHALQTTATAGMGVVSVFTTSGNFVSELVSPGNHLAAPWGIALAPSGFGQFSGDLLVGNFSFVDSGINAFDPTTGAFEGTIPINLGANSPGGLWDLTFGNGGNGGSLNTLYFTDGINSETDGLFGAISDVPEPSGLLLIAPALAFFAARRRRLSAQ